MTNVICSISKGTHRLGDAGLPAIHTRHRAATGVYTEVERVREMISKLQNHSGAGSGRARVRGQGLVEFALIAPLMIFMLLITVDFARAYSAHIEVSNAARAGAIYGSRSSAFAHDVNAVRAAALRETPSIFGKAPQVIPTPGSDSDGYERITVTVRYDFEPLIEFPGIPKSVQISRTVTMRVIG